MSAKQAKSRRSRKKKGRKRGRPGPPDPALPQHRFNPLAKRLDELQNHYRAKWPDGVNPDSLYEKKIGPLVRWYRSGDRSDRMYQAMKKLVRLLEVPECPSAEERNADVSAADVGPVRSGETESPAEI